VSELVQLRERVKSLENRMDNVENLAGRTGQEVAEWRATLNNHNKLLNGMGDKIDLFQKRVDQRFTEVDKRFDKLESALRAEMQKGFTEIGLGMAQITALLNIHLGEPGEETRGGSAGE
jgi:predicted  nucleic acid-binding Zn-ribbon protein